MILPDRNEILYTLDELLERHTAVMGQRLEHKQQQLHHAEALLMQNSPLRKLRETESAYRRLKEEFARTIGYRISRFEAELLPLKREFEQSMALLLRHKAQQADHLYEKMKMSDPRLQCKEGWAQVSKEGRAVTLDQIKKGENFIVEDATIRIKALCLDIVTRG
jgi:exodeoxyribonuclease VII large subunit